MNKTFLLTAVLLTAGVIKAEKNTAFSEEFTDAKSSGPNWHLSMNTAAIEGGKLHFNKGGNAKFKKSIPDNFTLTVDIAVAKPQADNKKLGFCGVDINGIKFMVRNDGKYWAIYRLPGEKKSRGKAGNITNFAFDKSYPLTISSKKEGDGFKYECKVGDKQIISFKFPGTQQRKINLFSYRTSSVFDNFKFEPES